MGLNKLPFILLALLLLVTTAALWPQLQIRWMLLDDGESARTALELSEHFSKSDFGWLFKLEAHNGYLRPTYWMAHWLWFSVLGDVTLNHRLIHLLVYVLSSLLIFLITKAISKDSLAAFLAGLFLLFFYPAAENLFRLGTNEPTVVLFMLGAFYGLIKAMQCNSWRFFGLSAASLLLAWFNKPTMVIFIPLSLLILVLFLLFPKGEKKHSKKFAIAFFAANLSIAALVLLLSLLFNVGGGYGSQYLLSWQSIEPPVKEYLRILGVSYGPVFYLLLISFFIKFWRESDWSKKEITWENKWKLIFFSLFVLLILVQIPWRFIMARYLPPALVGFAVILGLESSFFMRQGWKFLRGKNMVFSAVFFIPVILLLTHFLPTNIREIRKMYSQVVPGENRRATVVEYLAEKVPSDGRVFYNFSDGFVEFYYEMGLHFKLFHNRPDVQVAYLFLDNGFKFKEGDVIVTGPPYSQRYPWEKVKKLLDKGEVLRVIDNEWEVLRINKEQNVSSFVPEIPVPPPKNLLGERGYNYSDGDGELKIAAEVVPAKGGGISFYWKPPVGFEEMEKKVALVRQNNIEENLPEKLLVEADKRSLSFNIWDPWKNERRTLVAKEVFLSEKEYKVTFKWGKGGMTLTVGGSHLFLPYYAGLNSKKDLIIGSSFSDDFSDESGEMRDITIFTE